MHCSRRTFVRGLTAAVCSAPVVGFPAVVKRRDANSLLSHACVGVRNMGYVDLCGLMSHRDIHITALCDVDAAFLEQAKKKFPDVRVYRNAHEMLAAEGNRIDSINVSTPDHTHAGYVVDALGRGLNVYGQKPLCSRLEDVRRIERLGAEKQAVTQLGTQIAAHECDRQTVEVIRKRLIGDIRHVWLFSTRRSEPNPSAFAWPLKEDPVPATLDWKTWLGPEKYRPYSEKVYHPCRWRQWRDFGTSWLGDLGIHLMSPVWLGMDLGQTSPLSVVAEVADDGWTPAQREQFWPTTCHLTWQFPGSKYSGGKPFEVEWCDGFGNVGFRMEPRFMPPAFLQDIAARTSFGALPPQGRVIEGTEGWIVSSHYGQPPQLVMKSGKAAPKLPVMDGAPTHWHDFVDCCLQGGNPRSSFARTSRMTEMLLVGNAAQLTPGVVRRVNAKEGTLS